MINTTVTVVAKPPITTTKTAATAITIILHKPNGYLRTLTLNASVRSKPAPDTPIDSPVIPNNAAPTRVTGEPVGNK